MLSALIAGALTPAVVDFGGGPLVAILTTIILTLVGLLAWVVRLVITGKLVPGSERDYWREACLEEQRQKRELMVTAQVARATFQALPTGEGSPAPPSGDRS